MAAIPVRFGRPQKLDAPAENLQVPAGRYFARRLASVERQGALRNHQVYACVRGARKPPVGTSGSLTSGPRATDFIRDSGRQYARHPQS
jgi:hypothetical protein